MTRPSIGIVGGGVVGKATARAYTEWTEVRVYDLLPERRTHHLAEVLACELVMVCLPTPANDKGRLDLSALHALFGVVQVSIMTSRNYVIKSTVPVGTTQQLMKKYGLTSVAHSPEFITARTATLDAQLPPRNVVGYDKPNACSELLLELYRTRFPGTAVHHCNTQESELLKLLSNAFGAVKVAFFNEARDLADAHNMDWHHLRTMLLGGGTVHPAHTQVPGPDGKRGFGGSCLPKDLMQFANELSDVNLEPLVCIAAHESNRGRREDQVTS